MQVAPQLNELLYTRTVRTVVAPYRLQAVRPSTRSGVRYLVNASPLCMALLRDEKTPEWHPAYPAIREAADKAAAIAKEKGLSISDLASRFAFQGRDQHGFDATLIGLARKPEVQDAMRAWKDSKRKNTEVEDRVFEQIHALFAPHKNYSWQSPTDKELCKA